MLVGHKKAAELLMRRLSVSGSHTTNGMFNATSLDRHLGSAAVLLGRYDEARKYYVEAVKVCAEMKFRPELALTRLAL